MLPLPFLSRGESAKDRMQMQPSSCLQAGGHWEVGGSTGCERLADTRLAGCNSAQKVSREGLDFSCMSVSLTDQTLDRATCPELNTLEKRITLIPYLIHSFSKNALSIYDMPGSMIHYSVPTGNTFVRKVTDFKHDRLNKNILMCDYWKISHMLFFA